MIIEARAKVNWTLDILGQREDGYHLMDMLMQPVDLCDTLTLTDADGITLTMPGADAIPADRTNLVWRAAEALQKAAGTSQGVSIRLDKRIPSGAGLGGGSADAAAVLWGLNRLWCLHLSQAKLEEIGLTLGADVPFCLRGGLGRVQGIGERITDLPQGPVWPMVITQPCDALSTREVFHAYHAAGDLHRPNRHEAEAALLAGSARMLRACAANVMEQVSVVFRPQIAEATASLYAHGALYAAMSGSGSAVFGVFASHAEADAAAGALSMNWPKTFSCVSCNRSLRLIAE